MRIGLFGYGVVTRSPQGAAQVAADLPGVPVLRLANRELVDAARSAGLLLGAFHYRRWDTYVTPLRRVLDVGGRRQSRPSTNTLFGTGASTSRGSVRP